LLKLTHLWEHFFSFLVAMRLRIVVGRLAAGAALLLGGARAAGAQTTFFVPAPATAQVLDPAPTYVACVVDARPQHTTLGLVMRAGAPRLAVFEAGVASTLQTFFKWHAPGQPGAVPLVMRVSGLEMAEVPGGLTERALAGLVADFYAPQPDSSYRRVARFANVHTRTGLDATGLHADNLALLLLDAAKAAAAPTTEPASGLAYPRAAVLGAQPLPGEMLPALDPATGPRPGFYHTLPEFWLNAPAEAGLPQVERHPYQGAEWAGVDEVLPYRVLPNGRHPLALDVWGFCDGERYYIRRGRSFYELRRQGTGFVHFGQLEEDPEYRAAAGSRTASRAMVMGWAAAGATNTSGGKREQFTFSLLTGKSSLSQSSSAGGAVAGRPTHLFVYRPRGEKGPAVRIRLADDQPAQELAAGDFLTFEPASDQPLRVCLLPATGAPVYLPLTPTADAPTYLECRPTTPEPLRKVKDAAGAAALSKLVK
jgi:hypothetical protein